MDGRKQPIRGLWVRNGNYLARLSVEDPNTGKKEIRWVPLEDDQTHRPVETVPQAVAALARLKVKRTEDSLPVLRQCPKFTEYVPLYLKTIAAGQGAKKPRTIAREETALNLWLDHLRDIRLNKIRKPMIVAFRDQRRGQGCAPRTLNLDLIALRNVLKKAQDDGYLRSLPTEGIKAETVTTKARGLFTLEEIERIATVGDKPRFLNSRLAGPGEKGQPLKNVRQFGDYLRLLAFCGSRRDETLALKWEDVDFSLMQITIGASGESKNREPRVVDFNPSLKSHLESMHSRRALDSQWLFPSPQRGERDIPAKTLRESLLLAREAASVQLREEAAGLKDSHAKQARLKSAEKIARFGFHDCRHYFISTAVMAGIDFMTIARWVGHKDGGVLIGKVYGHLADEHRRRMAEKLVFQPTVVERAQTA